MLLLLILNSSALIYTPKDSCAGDLKIPFTPPAALDPLMTFSCVVVTLSSPDLNDALWGSQAPTSHADPCFLQEINWRDTNFVDPTTAPPHRLIFNASTKLTLQDFAPCVSTTTFRSTSSRPCPPFAWSGYFGLQKTSTSSCIDQIRPTNSYVSGERRVFFIAGQDPSDCTTSTLDTALKAYTLHKRGSQVIYALPVLMPPISIYKVTTVELTHR